MAPRRRIGRPGSLDPLTAGNARRMVPSDVAGRALRELDQELALWLLQRDVVGDRQDAGGVTEVVPERQVTAESRPTWVNRIDVERRPVVDERSRDGVCRVEDRSLQRVERRALDAEAATSWRVLSPDTTKMAADSMSSTAIAASTTAVS